LAAEGATLAGGENLNARGQVPALQAHRVECDNTIHQEAQHPRARHSSAVGQPRTAGQTHSAANVARCDQALPREFKAAANDGRVFHWSRKHAHIMDRVSLA
jgi:hypothetical protein